MNCPKCGNEIKVDELLVSQFQESIKKDLQAELQRRETELEEQRTEFNELSSRLTKEKQEIDELVSARVKTILSTKEEVLKEAIRKEINEEKSLQLQALENELIKKSSQVKELNQSKAQLETLRREMEEAETRITLEKEKEFSDRLDQARSTIKEQEQQASFLKLKEREKIIDDLKMKLDEAKRKAEQGSMQLQGEVQELSLEEMLRQLHVTDEVIPVGKGVNGADCLQIVKAQNGIEIGKILYESKNTKTFSDSWITKLKNDNLTAKADILVIVTHVMPKETNANINFVIKDGVWICKYHAAQDLTLALRFGLLKLQSFAITQQGKDSKMELLYKYLTSEEFKNVFEAILSGFRTIEEQHHSEKLRTMALWKKREQVLAQILSNTVGFYGSIKGISTSIPEIKMLEFPKAS
jgi:hypothetical protein